MAGIITNVDSDVQKLRKLKNEIEEVKKALKGINIKVDVDIAKGMEAQLKSLTDQYNALVMKVAEAEGKILLSTKRINDASEKIIQAQEKVSKAAGIPTNTGNTNSQGVNAAETASIQSQAKAYQDLKAEINGILGTREANVKRMVDEMNAIRLINVEIKKITKSQGESSSLSSAQQKRLEQLNNSLLTHKTALSEVRQTLSNNVKLDNVASTSMNGLSQSLSRMRIAYRELTEEERKSPIGKELLASINQADAKIKELDASIGNHARNVGNYKKEWNGLQYQMQILSRELPNFAINPQTGIISLTNNLPYLVDELKKAKDAHKAYIAEVKAGNKDLKAVPSVGKQILSSLFSWQTALIMGITLITAYRKEITEWVGGLFNAKDAIKELLSAEQEMALARKTAVSNSLKERSELDLLYKKLKDTTILTQERNAAISEWMKKYPQHSNIMNGELVSLGKLGSAYQSLSKQIVESAKARAYADEITELETKKDDTLTKRQNQYVTYLKAIEEKNKAEDEYKQKEKNGFGTATAKIAAKDKIFRAEQNVIDQKKAWEDLIKETKAYDESISIISKKIKVDDLFPQPKEGTYDYWMQQVQIADTALKQIKGEYLKVLKSGDKEKIKFIPEDVRNQYAGATKLKDQAEKALNIYGDSSSKQEDQAKKLRKEQEKYKLLMDKQNREKERMEIYSQYEMEQIEINGLQEGSEKVLRQRKLNHEKELEAIKREAEDKKLQEIEKARSAFEAKPDNKGKSFDVDKFVKSEPVKKQFTSFDKIADAKTKTENAKYNRGDDLKELLDKYQNFNRQRLKLENEYQEGEKILQDRMLKAKTEDEKKEIQEVMDELAKRRKKGMQEISKNEIEDSGIWKQLMGDIDALSTETLEKLLSDAEQLVKVTNLSAVDMKAMMDTINNARQNLIMRNPFKTLKEEYEKYQKAIKKGDKQGASTSWSNVEQASESIKNNISALGASLSSLGNTFSNELGEGIQKAVDVINDGVTAFEVFGKKREKSAGDTVKGISGIIGIITTLIGTVMDAFDTTAEEQARNIEYQRRQEGYWDSINYQVERYLELLKEATASDYFELAGKSLTTLEESRRKAYQDIVKSMPVGDVDGTTFGLSQLLINGRFASKMTEQNFGAKTAKEIFDFINANGGYDLENKLISEEAIWAMKSNADIWSKLPEWMQNAIDKFVELNDQAKELEETLNEDLFQTTSKNIEEAILEGLKSGKRGITDFGEDFEEIMRNALLQSFVIDQLRGKAQDFYKKYTLLADSDANGKLDLTADEISDLRKDWNDIIKAATEEAKNIDSIIGSSSSSQESTKKGFATASQDSIDELNGRFTAGQIAWEETKNQNILQSQSLNILTVKADSILSINTDTRNIADEIRTIQANSFLELQGIRENTGAIIKPIKDIAADIAEVKKNISKL